MPGGTSARPQRSSTRRPCRPPTPCRGLVAGGTAGNRTNGVKRHIAVDVCGLGLAVVVTAAWIQDRDAAHRLLAALRGSFSGIPANLGRRWLPRAAAGLGERCTRPFGSVDHQTAPRQHRIPRAAPSLGGGAHVRLDHQAPSLRACLRDPTRPPRGRHPHRHDPGLMTRRLART